MRFAYIFIVRMLRSVDHTATLNGSRAIKFFNVWQKMMLPSSAGQWWRINFPRSLSRFSHRTKKDLFEHVKIIKVLIRPAHMRRTD